jgi:superfamily II helicase
MKNERRIFMHSFIYQLSNEIIKEDDLLYEEELYDDFVGQIADYVNGNIDRNAAINELVISLTPYGIIYDPTDQSIVFKKGFKESFFKERFAKLKKYVSELTLEEFSGSTDTFPLYCIKKTIEDKYGMYIYSDNVYITLDEFVRNMEEGKKYYFGSAIDYHF